MTFTPLVEHTRGPLAEIIHAGAIAVVNAQGQLLAQAGDAQAVCFTRSTLKPFQALPFLLADGPAHFGYAPAHIAMLCASHNGEDMHVQAVDEMLAKSGHSYRALQCGCHVPLRLSYFGMTPPPELTYDERHNNCSGKHAGFLAYCSQHGLPLADHLAPSHPLQMAIAQRVAQATGCDESQWVAGTDGCSAPNYAMPLHNLAWAFARLASGAADAQFGAAFAPLSDAMRQHPELISGTGRNDLAFTQAGRGDWITKIGADGVQVIASVGRREAIAIKVASGHMPALYTAAAVSLDQLGWLDDAQREELKPWGPRPVLSVRGEVVGQVRAAFDLHSRGS